MIKKAWFSIVATAAQKQGQLVIDFNDFIWTKTHSQTRKSKNCHAFVRTLCLIFFSFSLWFAKTPIMHLKLPKLGIFYNHIWSFFFYLNENWNKELAIKSTIIFSFFGVLNSKILRIRNIFLRIQVKNYRDHLNAHFKPIEFDEER